ncbi:MAG: hypothetical protein U0401_07060 [Anaerolineae bacterium]
MKQTHSLTQAQLGLLFSITQSLSRHLELNTLLEHILTLTPDFKADFSALLVQEQDEPIYFRSTQPGCEELIGPAGRRFAQKLLKEGLEGWVLQHNQAAVISNSMRDSRWLKASYLLEQPYSIIAIPFTLARVEARGIYTLDYKLNPANLLALICLCSKR